MIIPKIVPSIGCIGNGFVGGALARGFAQYTDVKVYDVDQNRCANPYDETTRQDIIFVALPTPMMKNGECSVTIIADALEILDRRIEEEGRTTMLSSSKLTVLRSTVPPNFIRDSHKQWRNLKMVYMPEFLTERTSNLDFIQSTRFIFGTKGGRWVPKPLKRLFEARFPGTSQVAMTWEAASLVKYALNVFFASKVTVFNEIYEVAVALGQDPAKVINEVINDGRVGRSHFQVPGHDGDRGFGGHCFPKDLNSFIFFAEKSGADPIVARAVWEKNNQIRQNRDWEAQKGRAVV